MAESQGVDRERAMTSSILRTVLVVALILGVGVVLNIFKSQHSAGVQHATLVPAKPTPAEPTRETTKRTREADARRLRDAVRRELQSRGYLTQRAGGPSEVATGAAILAFEFDYGLDLTARPSNALLKALVFTHDPAGRPAHDVPKTIAARDLIAEVQRALAHLGYGRSRITTELDDATRKAIRKFERARGLQISGRVSAPLITSLGPAFDAARLGSIAQSADRDAG